MLMLDILFTSFTEIEVLTLATNISDTHNGLNTAAIALKLWCSLLNCTTRFLLNDLSKDVVYLALNFLADQILYSLHRYFSIFLLFADLWLFRFSRLLGFFLSLGELNYESNALYLRRDRLLQADEETIIVININELAIFLIKYSLNLVLYSTLFSI